MTDPTPTERFAAAITGSALDATLFAIAAHDHTVDIDAQVSSLDELAAACREARDVVQLARALFVDLGFKGNADDYYDPANSFLDLVLERRVGIPITLSVLLVEVGRRVGIDVVGIGQPGHFVARSAAAPFVYIDAFNGGQVVDVDDDRAPVSTPAATASRVLNNLQQIYARNGDAMSLAWVRRLLLLIPDATRVN